ncbi:MAG: formate--tetrahydrofolate ligase, partial [Hyphomicrobiaceae bacterium]|nr:formate--tetrahydrofolate ligase [Hyphomicrobiaceae bacterium]
ENVAAVTAGCANLGRHLDNVGKFGVNPIVALNHFASDTEREHAAVAEFCRQRGVTMHVCEHWARGGQGIAPLAADVAAMADADTARFAPLYPDDLPLWDKIRKIATDLYGASDISAQDGVAGRIAEFERAGYGHLPVCMAKTQYSFSVDPAKVGAPSGHVVPVREVILAAGARFVIVVCGDIMRMPGLPRHPSAEAIDVDDDGNISGLF